LQDVTTLPSSAARSFASAGLAWAFALNKTATCGDIEVSLLGLVVVDEILRVSALVRIRRRVDVGLSNVPTLSISTSDGATLLPTGAHLLPQGHEAVWVSWVYRRPPQLPGLYEARIDRLDLGNRRGKRPPEVVAGPWVFAFGLPMSGPTLQLIPRVD
jgi:hypothetical protein